MESLAPGARSSKCPLPLNRDNTSTVQLVAAIHYHFGYQNLSITKTPTLKMDADDEVRTSYPREHTRTRAHAKRARPLPSALPPQFD